MCNVVIHDPQNLDCEMIQSFPWIFRDFVEIWKCFCFPLHTVSSDWNDSCFTKSGKLSRITLSIMVKSWWYRAPFHFPRKTKNKKQKTKRTRKVRKVRKIRKVRKNRLFRSHLHPSSSKLKSSQPGPQAMSDPGSEAVISSSALRSRRWWKIKLFRGMIDDARRRAPYYWSDWRDAWNYRVVPATVYMYFAKYGPPVDARRWEAIVQILWCTKSYVKMSKCQNLFMPILSIFNVSVQLFCISLAVDGHVTSNPSRPVYYRHWPFRSTCFPRRRWVLASTRFSCHQYWAL